MSKLLNEHMIHFIKEDAEINHIRKDKILKNKNILSYLIIFSKLRFKR